LTDGEGGDILAARLADVTCSRWARVSGHLEEKHVSRDPRGEVAASYDVWSATYDRDDNPMIAMADRALSCLVPHIAGARVLELGCGTGRNAAALLAAGAAQYVGIDASAGMLAQARRRTADHRATWLHADLLDERPDVHGVDLVLFSLVLEHVATLPPAFARAAAALVTGGLVCALEIHPSLRAAGTQAHFRVGEREVPVPSYPHTAADYAAAVAAAGLDLVTTTDWFATRDDLAASRKLGKHLGKPVLMTLSARRPA
jgi:SAM-dependent methyltransferase